MTRTMTWLILQCLPCLLFAQNKMTPELLWKLGRVKGVGVTKDGKSVVYNVATPNSSDNKS
ncbi:MAG: hypothetical protein ABJA57_13215, partial [Ginsengibacter sp.]